MMDAFNLLGLDRSFLKEFSIQANRIDDSQTERIVRQNIRKLEEIETRSLANECLNIPKYSVDEVLYKISLSARHHDTDIDKWTTRDLRILSYYLMRFQDDDDVYKYALTLLDLKWKNLFFNGLVFYVLNSWNMIKPDLRKSTCQLIINKLHGYNDTNRKFLLYKDHANLFEEAGPIRMATLLTSKQQDVREAPLILGNKKMSLAQSYYSDVIVKYVEKNDVSLDYIAEIFEKHKVNRTQKLVFANLVEQADRTGDAYKQTQLSNYINRTLGDVTLPATWAPFPGATEEEALKLKKAMLLVNQWFTRRVIETFFEVCVQDKDRKRFWLNYVQHVNGFKIIGSSLVRNALQCDPRTRNMFSRHFIETNSSYSQTAALVLSIRDKVFVEFSDTGALYVYNHDNIKIRPLKNGVKYINSTNDLKQTDMPMLIELYQNGMAYFNDKGRMTHQGYWEYRLARWFKSIVFRSDNDYTPFFESPDESIFKAQVLPKQDPIKKPDPRSGNDDVLNFYDKTVVKPTEAPKTTISSTVMSTYSDEPTYKNFSQPSLLDKHEPKDPVPLSHTIQHIQKQAKYETNVKYVISSRWEFNNACRFVCNVNGYYLYLINGQRYYFLQSLIGKSEPMGSLWIKKPNKEGWIEIVHYVLGQELTVGYVKKEKSELIFMENLDLDKQLIIEL